MGRATSKDNEAKSKMKNLEICLHRDSKRGGSDLWSNTLPLDYGCAIWFGRSWVNIDSQISLKATARRNIFYLTFTLPFPFVFSVPTFVLFSASVVSMIGVLVKTRMAPFFWTLYSCEGVIWELAICFQMLRHLLHLHRVRSSHGLNFLL